MASPKKESTMEQTVREGKQFIGESDETPEPKKAGTMETTAKEGIEYLQREKKDLLLKAQGLVDDDVQEVTNGVEANGKHPSPTKQGTMAATANEAQVILESMGGPPDADAKTRGQQKTLEQDDAQTVTPKKDGTMLATAKVPARATAIRSTPKSRRPPGDGPKTGLGNSKPRISAGSASRCATLLKRAQPFALPFDLRRSSAKKRRVLFRSMSVPKPVRVRDVLAQMPTCKSCDTVSVFCRPWAMQSQPTTCAF